MALRVNIVADSKFPIDRKRIRSAMIRAWEDYGMNIEASVSLVIVGTRKIAFFNQTYLKREGPTDVLAFPQQSTRGDVRGFITPDEISLELGDVVVCFPLALDQAAKLGILVDERIEQLALHGFRNLMGNGELNNA